MTCEVEKANEVVDAAYKVTRDALAMGADHTRVLERFVGLHVPQMGEFFDGALVWICVSIHMTIWFCLCCNKLT